MNFYVSSEPPALVTTVLLELNAAMVEPTLNIQPAPADSAPSGCDADDALELVVQDDGKEIAQTIRCVPRGMIDRTEIVRDAKGRLYVLVEYMSDYKLKSDRLLTIFRIGSSFQKVYTAPIFWLAGLSRRSDIAIRPLLVWVRTFMSSFAANTTSRRRSDDAVHASRLERTEPSRLTPTTRPHPSASRTCAVRRHRAG